jgi:hypothetical protein
MASISIAARDALVAIHVAMFNAAPGSTVLSQMVLDYESGKTLKQIAAGFRTNADFRSQYPSFLTSEEFADRMVANLLGDNANAVTKAWSKNYIIGRLNAGVADTEVFVLAVNALRAATNTDFAAAQAQLENKLEVAKYYAIELQQDSTDYSTLRSIIANVTANDATVTQAEQSISNQVQTFTLTASAASVDEGGNVTFALTLDSAPSSAVTVNYVTATGTAGTSDYTSTSGTVTFAAGQTSQFVNIATTEDSAFEADETFTVTFSGSSLTASVTATGTITNDDVDTANQAQSFTLSSAANSYTGGAGNDTFSGTAGTVDSDVLVGGEGSDTLTLTVDNTEDNNAAFSATGIENLSIRTTATAGGVTLDVGDVTGVETLTANRLLTALTLTDVQDIANIVVDRNVSNANLTVTYGADVVSGTSDSVTVTITNSSNAGTVTIDGIETVNLVSNDNPTDDTNEIRIDAAGTGTATEVLNISGSGDLTIVATDALTINNSASGDVELTATVATEVNNDGVGDLTLVADLAEVVTHSGTGTLTFTVGAGVDVEITGSSSGEMDITANGAADLVITGGSGDDTFDMIATLATDDVIDGGDGDDTLVILGDGVTSAADGDIEVSNVETLEIQSDTAADNLDFDVFSDASGFDTVIVTSLADADEVTLTDVQSTTFTIRNAATANTADDLAAVTIDLKDSSGASTAVTVNIANRQLGTAGNQEAFTLGTLTAAGVETLTINTSKVSSAGTAEDITISTLTTAALSTLNINGAADFVVTNALSTTTDVINASGASGIVDVTVAGSDVTYTGGSGADTIRFGTSLNGNDNVDGGAGSDVVTATLSSGTITPVLTNVETLTLTGSGGAMNGSSLGDVSTIQFSNTSAMVLTGLKSDVETIQVLSGSSSVQLRYEAGAAATVTINNNAGTTAVDSVLTSTTVTNIENLTIAVDNNNAANAYLDLGALAADTVLKHITVTTDDDADDDADTGNITATALQTLTATAGTGGSITVGTLSSAAALTTLTATSTGGAVGIGAIGAGAAAAALTTIDVNATGGDIDVGAITATAATIASYDVTASGTYGTTSVGTLAAKQVSAFTVTATGTTGTSVTTGAMTLAGAIGDINVTSANDIAIGAITAGGTATNTGSIGNVTIAVSGAFGTSTVGNITTADSSSANVGNISLTTTGGAGTSLTVGNFSAADGSIGNLTISSADQIIVGTVTATGTSKNIGNVSATLTGTTHNGNSTLAAVTATGDTIGTVTINNSSSATFTAADFAAATVGDISITTNGDNAGGAVVVTTLANVSSTLGDINIDADANVTFTTGATAATTVGDITVAATAGTTVNLGTMGAATAVMGNVTASGAGTFTMTVGAATLVGDIDTSDLTGTANITLSNTTAIGVTYTGGAGVDNFTGTGAADLITAGAGADVINGNGGNDSIDLTESDDDAALDQVVLVFATANNVATISGFGATDQVVFDESVFATINFANTGAVATLAAGDYNEIAAAGALAGDSVNVITTAAGYADYDAAFAAVTAGAGDEVFVVFYNSTSGKTEVYFDADDSDDAGEVLIAQIDIVGANVAASLSEANFGVL